MSIGKVTGPVEIKMRNYVTHRRADRSAVWSLKFLSFVLYDHRGDPGCCYTVQWCYNGHFSADEKIGVFGGTVVIDKLVFVVHFGSLSEFEAKVFCLCFLRFFFLVIEAFFSSFWLAGLRAGCVSGWVSRWPWMEPSEKKKPGRAGAKTQTWIKSIFPVRFLSIFSCVAGFEAQMGSRHGRKKTNEETKQRPDATLFEHRVVFISLFQAPRNPAHVGPNFLNFSKKFFS